MIYKSLVLNSTLPLPSKSAPIEQNLFQSGFAKAMLLAIRRSCDAEGDGWAFGKEPGHDGGYPDTSSTLQERSPTNLSDTFRLSHICRWAPFHTSRSCLASHRCNSYGV